MYAFATIPPTTVSLVERMLVEHVDILRAGICLETTRVHARGNWLDVMDEYPGT